MLVDSYGHPIQSAPRAASPAPQANSPWWATQYNPTRKSLWNFSADPRDQVTPWARHQMDVQAQTLAANSGIAGCLKTLAGIVGFLKPQAMTGDSAYNEELEAAFARVAENPMIFDAAGELDFYSYQVESSEARYIRGELYCLFTETASGRASIAYRGAQCVGGKPEGGGEDWHDGILSNANGFPRAYYFRDKKGRGQVMGAADVFHHKNLHALGARRGITSLAHAINPMVDTVEIKGNMKAAIKNSSMVALTRRMDAQHGVAPSSYGLNAPVSVTPFDVPDMGSALAGEETRPPVSFEEYSQNGLFSSVPLDVLTDDRPHPNVMAFLDDIKREIAHGLGVPPQLLYFMDDPGGAWSRMLLESLVKFIARQYRRHLRPFCQRFWSYTIAKEIKAGRCPAPPRGMAPEMMWKTRWTPQRSMTADIGRLGRLTIEMRKAMLTTFAAHFEELGLDWEEELRQGAREIRFLKDLEKEEKLDPGTLTGWNAPANAPAQPAATAEQVETLAESIESLRSEIQSKKTAS